MNEWNQRTWIHFGIIFRWCWRREWAFNCHGFALVAHVSYVCWIERFPIGILMCSSYTICIILALCGKHLHTHTHNVSLSHFSPTANNKESYFMLTLISCTEFVYESNIPPSTLINQFQNVSYGTTIGERELSNEQTKNEINTSEIFYFQCIWLYYLFIMLKYTLSLLLYDFKKRSNFVDSLNEFAHVWFKLVTNRSDYSKGSSAHETFLSMQNNKLIFLKNHFFLSLLIILFSTPLYFKIVSTV